MRIAITSDWHGFLPRVPPCDLLVVAGDVGVRSDGAFEDFSVGGPPLLYSDLVHWIGELDCEIVAVAGNHDFNTDVLRSLPWTYLEDQVTEVGGLKIFGTPWSNPFGYGWAFNMSEEDQEINLRRYCPTDVDVIVSHGPPYGLGDRTLGYRGNPPEHVGSVALLDHTYECRELRLVACGHIHPAYGTHGPIGMVVNGSLVDEEYKVANAPIVVEL